MVHVTFNEKVECHQYNPTSTQTEMQPISRNDDKSHTSVGVASSSVRGQACLKYTKDFLNELKSSPLSQTCPDVVKKAIEEGKGWAGRNPYSVLPIPMGRPANKSVFSRPPNPQNTRLRRNITPYFNSQTNYAGFNRDEMNQPLEPIGSSRYTSQGRNFKNRNPVANHADNFMYNSNLLPDFAQRHDRQFTPGPKRTNEEDAEPEWYSGGPTSPNDVIELHGFEGPGNHDEQGNRVRTDHLGCVEGNVSGGPTSGASSNNGSPPAKSTPAKVSFSASVDFGRNKRFDAGRHNSWQNNFDNRQNSGAPVLNEFFKNFSGTQNQSNLRGITPLVNVQDIESTLLYDTLKFRQMVTQMQTQSFCRSLCYPLNEPIPTASRVLTEIDKILRTSNDPVYKRPEVRALTKNIVEAVIPPVNIMNLLKNPLTEPQNRETIQAALKVITQAKQNAVKTMKAHSPTESELRAHMDAILQDAIIKKRMENLSNELLKAPYYQPGGRYFPNQSFHQLFRPNTAGRFENHSQSDSRGQCQSFGNGTTLTQETNLNRWFSPTLLNKGLPQIPSESLHSEELESKFKQALKAKEVK